MKRSILLLALAAAVGSLALGVSLAGASGKAHKKPKKKVVSVTCATTLINQAEDGENVVLPSDSGRQYGQAKCSRFGAGVVADTYTIGDSGDTVAKYTRYFKEGSVSGTFDLTPDGGGYPTADSFQSQGFIGTLTVKSGTGIYKGIKGKSKGKMKCSSTDSVHLKCSDTVKVVLPKSAS